MTTDAIILIAVFVAALVQSTLGFGFSLVTVPILGIFIPVHQAICVTFIIGSLVSLFILHEHKQHVDFNKIKTLLILAFLGTIFAGIFLRNVQTHIIELIVYITLLLMSVYMLTGLKIRIKNHRLAQIGTGFLAGIVNTVAAVSGPIVVLYLQNIGIKKREFLALVSVILISLNILSLALFLKLYGRSAFINGWELLIMASFVPITIYLGKRIVTKINEQLFSKIVIASTSIIVIVKLIALI